MSNGTATRVGTDGSVHTEIVDMQQILPATTEKLLMVSDTSSQASAHCHAKVPLADPPHKVWKLVELN